MKKLLASIAAVFMLLGLLAQPIMAQQYSVGGSYTPQEPPEGDVMLYDLVLVRPVGLAACGLGLIGSLVAMPFAAMGHNEKEVSQRLIKDPFAFTFTRPLGHFDKVK